MMDKTPTVKQHGVAIGHDARHNSLRYWFTVFWHFCQFTSSVELVIT